MVTKGLAARCAALVLLASSLVGLGSLTQSASAATVTDPGAFISLTPSRILDTRAGSRAGVHPDGSPISGHVGAGQTLDVKVSGIGGVPPTGAGTVVLNVTLTQASGAGFVTVLPGDASTSTPPTASNLNFTAGLTIANLVTVRLPAAGDVKVYVGGTGSVELLADVAGYYVGGAPSAAGTMSPLHAPYRALDTRTPAPNPVSADAPRNLALANQGGLPPASSMAAVVLNVTVTAPSAPGYLTVYPGSSATPNASNLNFTTGQTIANSVTVKTGPAGDINLGVGGWSGVHADVIVDVAGYYVAGTATDPGTFVAVPPTRILETRSGYNLAGVSQPGVTAGTPVDLAVTGSGGGLVPATGVGAVVMNTTMISPTIGGYVVAYPADAAAVPNVSNLNFNAGDTIPNLVNVRLGASGDVKLLYSSYPGTGTGNLIADVDGYFRQGDPPPSPAPGPLMGLTATGVNAGEVDLSWTNPSFSTGTTICRSKTSVVMTPSTCASNGGTLFSAPSGATGYRDYFLYWSTTYYYTAWATNAAGTSGPATANGTTLSNVNSRQNPGSNTAPTGLSNYCDPNSTAITQACAAGAASDFNAARAADGLGPMAVPSSMSSLTPEQQLFVLTNIDRVDRGIPPLDGISVSLSNQALKSPYGQDPAFPAGTTQGGSNWSSTLNPMWTEFLWMYDDGLNSPNSDCSDAAPAGCWGHRLNVIGPYNAPTAMGEGISSSSGSGALYIGQSSSTDFAFTWASQIPYFPKGSPENP